MSGGTSAVFCAVRPSRRRTSDDRGISRASVSFSSAVVDFVASGAEAAMLYLEPTDASPTACTELGLDNTPLRVRAVRVELPSGQVEVLLTNFVEEGCKRLKSPLEIEDFSGLAVECVLQDIHARILLANMTVIAMLPVRETIEEQTADRELDYDISWTTAIAKVRKARVLLFLGHDIERVIDQLQEAGVKCLSPVRPGRTNPRAKKKHSKRFARNRKRA